MVSIFWTSGGNSKALNARRYSYFVKSRPKNLPSSKTFTKTAIVLAFVALGGCDYTSDPIVKVSDKTQSPNMCAKRSYPEIGGGFELTSMDGRRLTQNDFTQAINLVFFGFTNCPDICPATLVRLKNVYSRLPNTIDQPTTVFVSVDSARDTPELLARYLSLDAFPENTTGLTGSEEEVRQLAKQFFADYSKIEMPESLAEYTMDHTTLVYVMDENWMLKTFFTHEDTVSDMANCLTELFGQN